jgi:predicted small lipoprotein YifL
MRTRELHRWIAVFCCGIAILMASGCGKKTPLMLPEIPGQQVAAPHDLSLTLSDATLILSWAHAPVPGHAELPVHQFEVFMAEPGTCEGCPVVFRTVARVSAAEQTFRMPHDPLVRRYFRVQAIGKNPDARSGYSTTVMTDDL